MADVAALGAAHEAGLAHRERREVVVVEEGLLLLQPEVVELHVHPGRAQRDVGEDLRLTAGEQRRAVHAGRDVDLGLDRTDLVLSATVGTLLVDGDPLADHVLLEDAEVAADLALAGGVGLLVTGVGSESLDDLVLDRADRVLAGELVLDLRGLVELAAELVGDLGEQRLVGGRSLDVELLLAGLGGQLLHRPDELLDLAVGDVERVQDLGLGDAVGATLDHQDRLLGAGDDQIHLELLVAVLRRVDDEVAVELADPDGADQLLHRDRRDRQRGRGAVHREDVVGVHVIDRERHRDELRLEVPSLREQRPDRPVDHAGGKCCLLAGTRLAPEVGAGDAANCVVALLDVDGQGQEVDIAEVAHRRGAEHHRVAAADDDGAARLAGHLAGLERDLLAADLDGDSTHVKHAHVYFVFLPLGASRAWLRETVSRPMTSPARFRLLCLARRLHLTLGDERSMAPD